MSDNPSFEQAVDAWNTAVADLVDAYVKVARDVAALFPVTEWRVVKPDMYIYTNRDVKAKLIAKYWETGKRVRR